MRLDENIKRLRSLMNIKEEFDEQKTTNTNVFRVPTLNSVSISQLTLPSGYTGYTYKEGATTENTFAWGKDGYMSYPEDDKLFAYVLPGTLRAIKNNFGETYWMSLQRNADGSIIFGWYFTKDGKPYPYRADMSDVNNEKTKKNEELKKNYIVYPPNLNYVIPKRKNEIVVKVQNTSISPIEIVDVKFDGIDLKYLSNLVITKKPIPPGGMGEITFDYRPENDGKVPYNEKPDLIIKIKIGKEYSDYTLTFPHSVGSESKILEACENKFNAVEFENAKNWWREWFRNPVTKEKFKRNWNITTRETEKIFENYLEALLTAKLIYTISDDEQYQQYQGWTDVKGTIPQFLGLTTNGIDFPIYVNCGVDYMQPLTFFTHELQHILNATHKIHPHESEIFKGQSPNLKDEFKGTLSQRGEEARRRLEDEGLDPFNAVVVASDFDWRLKNDLIHLNQSDEISSQLGEVRQFLKLQPGQDITKKHLFDNADEGAVTTFLCQWLYSREELEDWLYLLNSMAKNNKKPQKTGLA